MRYIITSIIAILAYIFLAIIVGRANAQGTGIAPCKEIRIITLPFVVQQNYETSFAQLQVLTHSKDGENTVGAVLTQGYIKVEGGCTLTIGYTNPVLYVARELMRDQCAREHVFMHERHHVEIYVNALQRMDPTIRALYAQGTPLFEAAKLVMKAAREIQAEFDSPEEYHRNVTVCNRRIPRILNI